MTLDEFLRAFEALVDDREASDDPGEGNYGCEDCRACNNCRFCIGCDSCEDCTYCEESLDCTSCTQSKRCVSCKKVSYCEDSRECKESRYLTLCVECTDCVHCLACVGLDGGEFYVLNQKRPRKEYFALLRQVQELMVARMDGGWRPPGIGLASDVFDQAAASRDTELSAAPWLVEFIELAAAMEPEPELAVDEVFDDVGESEVTVQRGVSRAPMPERSEPTRERDYARSRERAPDRDYSRPRQPRTLERAPDRDYSAERDPTRERDSMRERDPMRERAPSRPGGLRAARAPLAPPEEDFRRGPERQARRGQERGSTRPAPTESTRELEPPRTAAPPRSPAPPLARPSAGGWREPEHARGGRDPREESNHDWMREPPAYGTNYAEPHEERARPPRQDYGHDLGRELGPEDDLDSEPVRPSETSNTQTYQRAGYEPEHDDSYASVADVPSLRTKEQPTQPFQRGEGRPGAAPARARVNTPRPPITREGQPGSAASEDGAPRVRGQEPSSPWLEEQPTQARRMAKRGSLRRAGRPTRPSADEERDARDMREGTGSESFRLGGEGTHTGLRLGRKPKRR